MCIRDSLYNEALTLRRQLAKDNPAVYLLNVATTLNNLGTLVAADSQRRKEAETLYTEALNSYRELAKDNSAVYPPYVAMTLNNLGTVSYTHLDVYKRQPCKRWRTCASRWLMAQLRRGSYGQIQ